MLVLCIALLRVGHLNKVHNIFAYLKYHNNAEIVFEPSELDIDIDTEFPRQDWSNTVYSNCKEELLHNIAEERGLRFKIIIYVDSNYTEDNSTQRSRTRFIVFLN